MLTPNQRAQIRAHHERAARILSYNQLPTTAEFIQIVNDLGDMLAEHTNSQRNGHV